MFDLSPNVKKHVEQTEAAGKATESKSKAKAKPKKKEKAS